MPKVPESALYFSVFLLQYRTNSVVSDPRSFEAWIEEGAAFFGDDENTLGIFPSQELRENLALDLKKGKILFLSRGCMRRNDLC